MIRNLLVSTGLFAAVFAGSVAAYANRHVVTGGAPQVVTISFDGLDLSSPQGRKMLDYRIRTGLDQVCGRADGNAALFLQAGIRKCRREAMAGARTQIAAAVDVAVRRRQLADARGRYAAKSVLLAGN